MTPGNEQGRDALAAVQESIRQAAEAGEMDQERAPMLEALEAYNAIETVSFSIPAHKGGGAIDDATRSIMGVDPYRADAPAHKGLDDRISSFQVLSYAQDLAADASAPTRRCSPPTARR